MEPMTMMAIGSAVAGGLQSIFGGKAQAAAIERQNQQAFQNWIASNTQKTFNNAREQFQSTYAFSQQMKRNQAIAENAYNYQYEAMSTSKYNKLLAQRDMSYAINSNRAALLNSVLAKGISSGSGLYGMMATTQALDAINKSSQANMAIKAEQEQINQQFKGMMSQQTENIFMPNIQMYDAEPIYGDASAAATGGLVSGLIQIGGALGAAGLEGMKDTPTTTSGKPNQYGTDLSKAPSGYTYNSTASQTTFRRTSSPSSTLNWYRR